MSVFMSVCECMHVCVHACMCACTELLSSQGLGSFCFRRLSSRMTETTSPARVSRDLVLSERWSQSKVGCISEAD